MVKQGLSQARVRGLAQEALRLVSIGLLPEQHENGQLGLNGRVSWPLEPSISRQAEMPQGPARRRPPAARRQR
jgi:hypothetical protein